MEGIHEHEDGHRVWIVRAGHLICASCASHGKVYFRDRGLGPLSDEERSQLASIALPVAREEVRPNGNK